MTSVNRRGPSVSNDETEAGAHQGASGVWPRLARLIRPIGFPGPGRRAVPDPTANCQESVSSTHRLMRHWAHATRPVVATRRSGASRRDVSLEVVWLGSLPNGPSRPSGTPATRGMRSQARAHPPRAATPCLGAARPRGSARHRTRCPAGPRSNLSSTSRRAPAADPSPCTNPAASGTTPSRGTARYSDASSGRHRVQKEGRPLRNRQDNRVRTGGRMRKSAAVGSSRFLVVGAPASAATAGAAVLEGAKHHLICCACGPHGRRGRPCAEAWAGVGEPSRSALLPVGRARCACSKFRAMSAPLSVADAGA